MPSSQLGKNALSMLFAFFDDLAAPANTSKNANIEPLPAVVAQLQLG